MNTFKNSITILLFILSIFLVAFSLTNKAVFINNKPKQFQDIKTKVLGESTNIVSEIDKVEIEDLVMGEGKEAQLGSTIRVNYTGTLQDGTVFDTNQGNDPIEFKLEVGSLIEGWIIGIPGMKEGGTRKLTVPSEYAYGSQEVGNIPANSTLIFEVELVEAVE